MLIAILQQPRYRCLTKDELRLAFLLNLEGAYDKRIEHFHVFDCDYLTRVLNEYLKYKIAELIKLNKAVPIIEYPQPLISLQEKYDAQTAFLAALYERYVQNPKYFTEPSNLLSSFISTAADYINEREEFRVFKKTLNSPQVVEDCKLQWLTQRRKNITAGLKVKDASRTQPHKDELILLVKIYWVTEYFKHLQQNNLKIK
jgi:hypothetical protein